MRYNTDEGKDCVTFLEREDQTTEGNTTTGSTKTAPLRDARDRAVLAAQAAKHLKGRDVLVLDMTDLVDWVDYLVIVTGNSRRQIAALADHLEKTLLDVGDHKLGTEGYDRGDWVVLDFTDLVIHLFSDEKRSYYELEQLWADAPQVPVPDEEGLISTTPSDDQADDELSNAGGPLSLDDESPLPSPYQRANDFGDQPNSSWPSP